MTGTGVDTPRAFASFARRCGGKGARGGAQVGGKMVGSGASPFSGSERGMGDV